jgi:hypothetical protein
MENQNPNQLNSAELVFSSLSGSENKQQIRFCNIYVVTAMNK